MYRCPKCKTEYRPLDAGARHHLCCGVYLQRVAVGKQKVATSSLSRASESTLSATSRATQNSSSTEVLEIIPPRENMKDVLAIDELLSTLATETPFALEIAGDSRLRHFMIRAPYETLVHLRQQIQATYDQADFRAVPPEQDPARADGLARMSATFTLRRPVYLPLRTFRDGDFLEADPVRGLLGAFANLETGERMLSQLILFPAPSNWADRYQGSTRQIEQSFGGNNAGAPSKDLFIRQAITLGISLVLLGFVLWGIIAYLQHRWLEFGLAVVLGLATLIGTVYLYMLVMEQTNVNPEMVKLKTDTPAAYDAALRVVAFAKTPEQARSRLRHLVKAYRQFNLASGNALVVQLAEFDPKDISLPLWPWWQEWLGRGMRLNVAEITAMWHLPVGLEVPFLERTQAKRLLPLPTTVEKGILIGHAVHQGEKIPVHLDADALWHHIFMVAKTQKGKSTLMAHLAAETMRHAERSALVVIDPHGDLTRSLLGVVPRSRASDVIYIDFSDKRQVVGLNLLDMNQGRDADVIVSNIVHVGELIWSDYWGPRMEDALRMALRTLLCANEILARRGDLQFTLLDIPPLFELTNFRHRLLEQYVSDKKILEWWSGYFERLYESLRMDVINPVLTKIHRFSTHSTVRNIVGQSSSSVNFREILEKRRILLVNTATGVIGPDAGGLLGAVLVDYINFAVREQMAIPDPAARARAVVVIDEFQSIPGVDYKGLLAELQKMGASFILATQGLKQLDVINAELRPAIMNNIATLFVFQTSAEDAKNLLGELDDAVTVTDIVNLDDYTCYIKTQRGRSRLPVMHVQTLPPRASDSSVVAQIASQMSRYTRSITLAESERDRFEEQWYGRERNLLRQLMMQGRTSKKSQKNSQGAEDETTTASQSVEPNSAKEQTSQESTPRQPHSQEPTSPPQSSQESKSENHDDTNSKDKGTSGIPKAANP
jgi:hypothetical protein